MKSYNSIGAEDIKNDTSATDTPQKHPPSSPGIKRSGPDSVDEEAKTNRMYILFVIAAFVIIAFLSVPAVFSKYMDKGPAVYFTEIDNSMPYTIEPDSVINIPCLEENSGSSIVINYTLFDTTMNMHCYDNVLSAGEVTEWRPGDYISDRDAPHEIIITQTAYFKDDIMYENPVDTAETKITVIVSNNVNYGDMAENADNTDKPVQDESDNADTSYNTDVSDNPGSDIVTADDSRTQEPYTVPDDTAYDPPGDAINGNTDIPE